MKKICSGEEKKYSKFIKSLINHKVFIISIIFIVLFFVFETLGIQHENNKNKFLSHIFIALASQCVGIGILSLIWELFIEKSWFKLVQNQISDTLTKPEVVEYLNDDYQIRMLEQLLLNISGQHIGKTVYKSIENNSFNENKMMKDFVYNISLTEKNDEFYNANFYIKFTTSEIPKDLSIRFTKLNSGLEIHNFYQDLVKTHTDIYRYILLSGYENLPDKCFLITECKIKSNNLEVKLNPIYPDNLLEESIKLKPNQGDKSKFNKICKSKNCEIAIYINTIIDKNWNYFPIMFGYPVNKFNTRLDASNVGISQIDILEFFTSSGDFLRDEGIIGDVIAASGRLDEIMLPDSGLVYVWK